MFVNFFKCNRYDHSNNTLKLNMSDLIFLQQFPQQKTYGFELPENITDINAFMQYFRQSLQKLFITCVVSKKCKTFNLPMHHTSQNNKDSLLINGVSSEQDSNSNDSFEIHMDTYEPSLKRESIFTNKTSFELN